MDERSNDSNRSGQNPHQHHHRSYLQPKRPSNVVKRCCSTSEEEKQSFVSHVGTVTGVAVNERYNVLNMPASTGTAFRKLNERGENLTRILTRSQKTGMTDFLIQYYVASTVASYKCRWESSQPGGKRYNWRLRNKILSHRFSTKNRQRAHALQSSAPYKD